jgi:hypothetical protein
MLNTLHQHSSKISVQITFDNSVHISIVVKKREDFIFLNCENYGCKIGHEVNQKR